MTPWNSGYRRDLENLPRLRAKSKPVACAVLAGAPDEIDCRGWLNIENQGSANSCAGHMLSSVLEYCNWVDTKGGVVQLSRMFAYLNGQKHAGLYGSDQGCTIGGVCEGAKADGICQEETFPYPGRYDSDIPKAAYDEAKEHKLRSYTMLTNYDDVFAYLAAGLGAVCCGVPWLESLSEAGGVIDGLHGRMYGWHAVPLIGYSKRLSDAGNHYVWMANSHGRQWGSGGWAEVAPIVVETWGFNGCVMLGCSDLEEYGDGRPLSWKGALSG